VRFKGTLILLAVFAALLAFVLVFESRGRKEQAVKEKEQTLVDVRSSDIRKMELKRPDGTISFVKDDKGEWRISAPLEAKADGTEVDGLAAAFSNLHIERVIEKTAVDLKTYGIPRDEFSFWIKGKDTPVTILIGMENPLDQTFFAKRQDDPRIVLLPSSLKSTLDKKLSDFRDKTLFKYETADVKSVVVRAKGVLWEAVRDGDSWRLVSPVRALAAKSKIDTLLESLSGLRAKDFLSEDKSPADIKKYGLEKPEYEVTLRLPAANRDIIFSLHKDAAASYAMTSQSNKIVSFEGSLLADLDRKPDELREPKVADFYSWEADRISLKTPGFALEAAKQKVKDEEHWVLEKPSPGPADQAKIDALLSKIEGLEAADFIDNPRRLAAYGLEKPAAEIRIRAKDYDNKVKEIGLLVGNEDKTKKQVIVKDEKLDYLFRVDSSFLQDLPKSVQDWRQTPSQAPAAREKK